jgi:selenocysteine lyase/cysteine desulfurase
MKRMELQSACRISMGIYNTEEDVKRLITALKGLG